MYYLMPIQRYDIPLTVEYSVEHDNGRPYAFQVQADRVWHQGADILELLSSTELYLLESEAREHYIQHHHPLEMEEARQQQKADAAWHDGLFSNSLALMQQGLTA